MNLNTILRLLLLPALIFILISCGGNNQITDTPKPLPKPTFTPASPTNNATPTEAYPTPRVTAVQASSPTPTRERKPTFTPALPTNNTTTTEAYPTPRVTAVPVSSPTPTRKRKPTFTPVPTNNSTIIGTVKFQVESQTVISAAELGQASIVGPSLIRLKDESYRLYIQARADRDNENIDGVNIISLISTDGIHWNHEPGTRISHGNESDVDSEAGEPGVYLGLDGHYYMAYTGRFMGTNRAGKDQKMHRVVFAVSEDSLTWTKLNQHYSDPQNINDFASSADVTIVNGEHVIYYTGQRNIIRAASDDGLTWNREEIAFSAGHDSTMVKIDDTYYMFWTMPRELVYGSNADPHQDILFMALSNNGVNWPNDYHQLVVENPDGSEVDAQDIQDPGAILISDGSLRIFLNDLGGKNIYSIKPITTLPSLK